MPAAMVGVQEQYALFFFGKERAPSESILGVRAVPLFAENPRGLILGNPRPYTRMLMRYRGVGKRACSVSFLEEFFSDSQEA